VRTALILAALTAALYLPRLGTAPVYISPDEVVVALNAHAIATTGRDTSGRLLPLYFEYKYPGPFINGHGTTRSGWLPPMIFYATAAVFEVLPVSETIVRLPTALIGILNVVLAYLVGRRLFRSEPVAIASAAFLALTPAHFIHSRFAMDYIYPLPFVLAWMLWLLEYFESNRPRMLLMSTAALGIGMFSYIAATVIMPILFLITWYAPVVSQPPGFSPPRCCTSHGWRCIRAAAAMFLRSTRSTVPPASARCSRSTGSAICWGTSGPSTIRASCFSTGQWS